MKQMLMVFVVAGVILGGVWALTYFNSKTSCTGDACITASDLPQVARGEIDKEVETTKKIYESEKQNLSQYPSLEKDVYEQMIDKAIITRFATENNITVTDEELQKRYKEVVVKKVKNSSNINLYTSTLENEFTKAVLLPLGLNREEYLERLRYDVLKIKVQAQLDKPLYEWLANIKKSMEIDRNI